MGRGGRGRDVDLYSGTFPMKAAQQFNAPFLPANLESCRSCADRSAGMRRAGNERERERERERVTERERERERLIYPIQGISAGRRAAVMLPGMLEGLLQMR
jgi:hypothetical protein